MIDLSEEEQNCSEIISVGTSVTTANTAIYDDTELQSESSGSELSDSVILRMTACVSGKIAWIRNGRKIDRFSEKYYATSEGELRNNRNSPDIYEYFLNDEICEHIAEQMNLYAEQKIHEKTLLNKMQQSQDKYWIPTCKNEMKLLSGILLLQGIVQKPKMGDYFS
jgi:hypothetical protein